MDIPSEELWNKSRIPLRIVAGVAGIGSAYIAYFREAPNMYLSAIAMVGIFGMTFSKGKEPPGGFPPGELRRRFRIAVCIMAGVVAAESFYFAYQSGESRLYVVAIVMALLFLGTLRKWRK